MTVQLGQIVKDEISGLEGKVIAITDWLYGCRRVTFQPNGSKDGKPFETVTIDEPQCEVVNAEAAPVTAPRHGARDDASALRR